MRNKNAVHVTWVKSWDELKIFLRLERFEQSFMRVWAAKTFRDSSAIFSKVKSVGDDPQLGK